MKINEKRVLTLVLGHSELRTLWKLTKGQRSNGRHGYVYTYPGSFQANRGLKWVWGIYIYTAWSLLLAQVS